MCIRTSENIQTKFDVTLHGFKTRRLHATALVSSFSTEVNRRLVVPSVQRKERGCLCRKGTSFKCLVVLALEFWNWQLTQTSQILVFEETGNRSSRRKPLGSEQRTNKLNSHLTPDLGIEPGPQWWKASALTTAPSLHPLVKHFLVCFCNESSTGTAVSF